MLKQTEHGTVAGAEIRSRRSSDWVDNSWISAKRMFIGRNQCRSMRRVFWAAPADDEPMGW